MPDSARAVLWDLDGTLVDSERYHWLAWQRIMAAEGIAITREQFQSTFGQRNDSILPSWLGAGASPERMRRIGDEKEALYRQLLQEDRLTALPGATEWVKRLHDTGWRQAIASSAPRLNVEAMLGALGLTGFFDATVASEDVSHGKPDPEIFLTAASRLGVPPARCVVVEDAAAGVEAGRRAGMRTIGLRSGGTAADLPALSLDRLPPDTFDRLLEQGA